MADFSNKDIRGCRGESLTLGVNWHWNPNASLQFNYIRGEFSERNEDVGGTLSTAGDDDILGLPPACGSLWVRPGGARP